jgi:hypothetical protein
VLGVSRATASCNAAFANQPHPLQLELANYAWILLENKGFSGEETEASETAEERVCSCVLADTEGAGCCQTK